ncbi:MAG: hypothetical protein WBQ79_05420 [Acidobacteriaceae bacterium]
MAKHAAETEFIVGWGGLESVTGPTVRYRIPGVEPFAEYGTEASIGNAETTGIVISVDTAWRSACASCMDGEIEDIERRLVTATMPELLARYQGQRELFSGEVRFTLSAAEMIQQYEELGNRRL